jgi:hypothetical protein
MTAKMVGTCEACQKNKHENCANPAACICSMRGHPLITRPQFIANLYQPQPDAQ